MAGSSTTSVIAGISANVLVTAAKFVGFAVSGSGALLSEAIHSAADTANQSLLLVGIKKAERPPDRHHPRGYGKARFFWGLVSALGIFFLGAGVTIYHGVNSLMHPHASQHGWVSWGVIGLSFLLEGLALGVAMLGIAKDARRQRVGIMRFLREGRDPTALAVVLEDSAAVLGLVFAVAGMGLEALTGWPGWDAMASLLIGLLLGCVAVFLIAKNRVFLLAKGIDRETMEKLRAIVEQHDTVKEIVNLTGVLIALDRYDVSTDVVFDGRALATKMLSRGEVDTAPVPSGPDATKQFLTDFSERLVAHLADEVAEIERKVREAVPQVVYFDLETHGRRSPTEEAW